MNYRLIKADLYTDKAECIKAAQAGGRGQSAGYVYSCRKADSKTGENLNHGYKSEAPVMITGCEYIEDIYTYIYKEE